MAEIRQALANNLIDQKIASTLLYGLQIAQSKASTPCRAKSDG
jgi:hypothetical protein